MDVHDLIDIVLDGLIRRHHDRIKLVPIDNDSLKMALEDYTGRRSIVQGTDLNDYLILWTARGYAKRLAERLGREVRAKIATFDKRFPASRDELLVLA